MRLKLGEEIQIETKWQAWSPTNSAPRPAPQTQIHAIFLHYITRESGANREVIIGADYELSLIEGSINFLNFGFVEYYGFGVSEIWKM